MQILTASRFSRPPWAIACAAIAAACSGGENTGAGLHGGSATRASAWTPETAWRLVEDLRLGGDGTSASEEERFSQIADILEGPDGSILVLDFQTQDVRVFDAHGSAVGRIGRQGEGPGEFDGAAGLDLDENGQIWVWDTGRNQRYTVLDSGGDVRATYRRPAAGVSYPWGGGPTAGFGYVDWAVARPGDGPGHVGAESFFIPVVFTPPDRVDTLPAFRHLSDMASDGSPKPLSSRFRYALDRRSGTVWFAESHEYTLVQRALTGDTLRVIHRPSRPMAVTTAERDSIVRASLQYPGWRIEPDDVSSVRGVVERIVIDAAGRVWVAAQEEGVPAGTVLDVFSPEGDYLGRIPLPDRIEITRPPPLVTENHLYAVVTDAYDVPTVIRYRIVRPEAAASGGAP